MSFKVDIVQLEVPYEMREEAKKYKCFYEPLQKLWNCRINCDDDNDKTDFINKFQQVYLNVPYEEKNDAKLKGAKWDSKTRTWYTYKGNQELQKYM